MAYLLDKAEELTKKFGLSQLTEDEKQEIENEIANLESNLPNKPDESARPFQGSLLKLAFYYELLGCQKRQNRRFIDALKELKVRRENEFFSWRNRMVEFTVLRNENNQV